MNVDTDRCAGVFSNCGGEEWRERVPPEHYCLGEGSWDKTQFSVPNCKSQTTDGSSCRGKRATAIGWEREGERETEGGAGEEVQERSLKCFSALLTAGLHWLPCSPIKSQRERGFGENLLKRLFVHWVFHSVSCYTQHKLVYTYTFFSSNRLLLNQNNIPYCVFVPFEFCSKTGGFPPSP